MVASPNLTLTITAPGGSPVDYTTHLAYSGTGAQNVIQQNFGRQGDTATFVLVDEFVSTPNITIVEMSQIKLFDHIAGETLFAGVVHTPELVVDGPLRREWILGCTDYAFYADNAIVHGVFYGQGADEVVVELTGQAACGITATAVHLGGFVASGPVLPAAVINYKTLSEAWKQLAQLASQSTPYGWYVDENLVLHFYDSTTALSSGVTFTTTPTAAGAGSTTEGHFALDSAFSYAWDGASIRNRILVQGATQTVKVPTTGPPTDTFRADGVGSSWPLRYSLTGTPLLLVDGAFTNLTVASGGATSTDAWVAEQNRFGGWFLTTTTGPGAGKKIEIWYDYQVPIVARANDTPSQAQYTGPNGGVFAEYISDTSLTTAPMALARAQRERTEYAFAVERMTWTVTEEFMGWVRAGQTCLVTNAFIPDSRVGGRPLGITNATFLIVANTVTFGAGGYRTMALTGVRL